MTFLAEFGFFCKWIEWEDGQKIWGLDWFSRVRLRSNIFESTIIQLPVDISTGNGMIVDFWGKALKKQESEKGRGDRGVVNFFSSFAIHFNNIGWIFITLRKWIDLGFLTMPLLHSQSHAYLLIRDLQSLLNHISSEWSY